MEKDIANKKKIKKALTYPTIVLCVAAVVVFVLMTVVMPKMTDLLQDTGTKLPLTTRMLIGSSDFFNNYKIFLLLFSALVIAGLMAYASRPSGRYRVDRLILAAPVIGKANLMGEMARMSRMLIIMLRAGLSLPEIMVLVKQTSGNAVVKKSLDEVRTGLLKGEGLSGPMSRDAIFPNLMVQMVMVGEESGRLESTLETVASAYETESDEAVTSMIAMIEPVMTIVLGIMVGFIALSVIVPMYSMAGSIK